MKLVIGSAFFFAGSASLYFKVIKRFQATNLDHQLNPGLIFPAIIASVLLLIGYAIIFSIDFTRFDLRKRTYRRCYGVFPFNREAFGQIEEDLMEVRIEALDERSLPGEEFWTLSLIWTARPRTNKERSQFLRSEAGRIENGRNTALAELERGGLELAQLLRVPLCIHPTWWESKIQAGAAGRAEIDHAPLPDLGYSSPLQYRFRRRDERHAIIEPSSAMLWISVAVFLFCVAALVGIVVVSGPTDIWFLAVFGVAISLLLAVVAWIIRSQPKVFLDRAARALPWFPTRTVHRVVGIFSSSF